MDAWNLFTKADCAGELMQKAARGGGPGKMGWFLPGTCLQSKMASREHGRHSAVSHACSIPNAHGKESLSLPDLGTMFENLSKRSNFNSSKVDTFGSYARHTNKSYVAENASCSPATSFGRQALALCHTRPPNDERSDRLQYVHCRPLLLELKGATTPERHGTAHYLRASTCDRFTLSRLQMSFLRTTMRATAAVEDFDYISRLLRNHLSSYGATSSSTQRNTTTAS